jgi:hypothetical protein
MAVVEVYRARRNRVITFSRLTAVIATAVAAAGRVAVS